ncbi:MAG: VCBS repeat-containing protein, partial [Chromatiales bacterium]|nr:VCBS repeat-containing protein [Chromatiales bacterium]
MKPRSNAACYQQCAIAGALLLAPVMLFAQPAFEDATEAAGLTHSGETWGASWGELNGDGYPDVFVGNHREAPSLYLNNGDGTFTEVLELLDMDGLWADKPRQDNHGASWADFDGDGDQDLYVTVTGGGNAPGHLLVNEGGFLFDRAGLHRLGEDSSARSPIWVDINQDGDLDMIFMNFGSARVFRQYSTTPITFNRDYRTGMDCSGMDYGQLSDLDGDGSMEFICGNGNFPVGVYDLTRYPFRDITSTVDRVTRTNDSAIADFDGDLDPDIFVVTGQKHPSGVGQVDALSLEASVGVGPGVENGITFESDGLVTFKVQAKDDFNSPDFFFIGQSGVHPADITFTLDPNDSWVEGIYPHNPSTQEGVFVGYDSSLGQWQLLLSSRQNRSAGAYIEISSTLPINNPQMVILEPEDLPRKPELLINDGGILTSQGGSYGLTEKIMCISAAAGDYDNDRDVDVYLVCRDGVRNLANRFYENQGDGTFTLIAGGHGAEGVQGFHLADGAGLGESAITA